MNAPASIPAALADVAGLPLPDRVARLRGLVSDASGLNAVIDHAASLTGADSETALDATETAVALSDAIGGADVRAKSRRARARALSYAGRLDEALAVTDEAIEVAERAEAWTESGRARLASMHALGELGRFAEAIEAGRVAHDLFERIGAKELAARADINLGVVHQRQGRPETALASFDRAQQGLRPDDPAIGHLENNRGEALLELARFAEAEAAFRIALERFEQHHASLNAAIADSNLGDLAARQGDLARALSHFESARRRFEEAGSAAHEARLLAERADAIATLGLAGDAVHAYREALRSLDACGLVAEAARARCGLGQVLIRQGERADAETALAAAARAFDEMSHPAARARVDLVRGELALLAGHTQAARLLAIRALAERESCPLDASAARHLAARAAALDGDTRMASNELDTALALLEPLGVAPRLGDVLDTRGRLHRQLGRLDEAARDFERAMVLIDRGRDDLPSERLRRAFLGDRSRTALALTDVLTRRARPGDIERGFEVAERARSRGLLDRIDGASASVPAGPDTAERTRLRRELRALYDQLERDADPGARRLERWRRSVSERERRLADLEDRLAMDHATDIRYARPVRLPQLQAALAPDDTLLSFVLTEDGLIAWRVTADDIAIHRATVAPGVIARHLEDLRFQVDRAQARGPGNGARAQRRVDDTRAILRALYDVLIAPVLPDHHAGSRLVIVPHGALHCVPWSALWDGHRYLVERGPVHVAPSASLWLALSRLPEHRADGEPLVVGVPDAVAPGIEDEARAIAAHLGLEDERCLLGAAATRSRFATRATRAPLIHCAAHGRFVADHPQASGLRLADGWLTPGDLAELKLSADLVVLSACDTGRTAVDAADELTGLPAALFAAGAANVLVGLWRLDDTASVCFMRDLYAAPGSMAERVRTSLLHALERDPHPAFWAPFALIGRG